MQTPNMSTKEEVSSTEEVLQEVPTYLGFSGTTLHRAISFIAGTGFLLFGYDQGVMGSLLTLDSFRDTFSEINVMAHPSKATFQGFVVAVYEIGCLAGALSTMYFGDKLGRRKTIFYGCIIMIIGATIQCSSFSVEQLIVGRIVTGYGNGMNTSTVPVWQSECAKAEKRGKLVMIQGSLVTAGICISYWVDFGFYFVTTNSASWRFPLAFQIVFPIVILPVILSLPESPRWLLKAGNVTEAKKVFAALDDVPLSDSVVEADVNEILAALEEETAGGQRTSITEMFRQGEARSFHRVMLGLWSQIMQQITGINLITYYAGTIFESYIGMSALNSRILAACNGTEYFIASWLSFYTIERLGRRPLLLIGSAGQALTMAALTGCTWAAQHRDDHNAAIGAAVLLFVFNSFFAIGWLGIAWLYPAEITPLNIRAAANGLSTAGNWSFNFMVVMIVPVAFENIQSYTYTIFAVINLLMVPAVYFLYPETAGRSLEEMDKIFVQSNPWTPWDVVGIARNMPKESEVSHAMDEEKGYVTHREVLSVEKQ